MKKGQILEGKVERLDFPNKGIVKTEEGVCIVKNVLPEQKISLTVKKKRDGKGEGRLNAVIEKSPSEIESPCSKSDVCGGCSYLTLPYDEQCELKKNQVKRILDAALDKQVEPYIFEGIKKSPKIFGYRNKMEMTFGDEVKDGPLSLGMHKRNSFYDIVYVPTCNIMDEDYHTVLKAVRDFCAENNWPFYHKMSKEGFLRHLLMRKASSTGEILVALVTTTQMKVDLQPFCDMLLNLPYQGKLVGILHTMNDSLADIVQNDKTEILYGQDFFYEELLGLRFKISEFSFFQTNSYGAEVLYQTAREYIGDIAKENATIFDLYTGTGTIAQLMAPVAKEVVGVEIVEEAVEAAKKNAEMNGLTNCRFIAGDVLKVLDDIEEIPDFIILDPPRDGVHPKALKKILQYNVERMVYISCKPTSLARDLESFLEAGYHVEKAVAVDQFPWSANVETVVLLSR